jgi:hypothetical protein
MVVLQRGHYSRNWRKHKNYHQKHPIYKINSIVVEDNYNDVSILNLEYWLPADKEK